MNVLLRRLATVLAAVVVVAMAVPFTADAQAGPAPSGGITLTPATGTDLTPLSGTTSGPCTATGASGVQVWVTGPGPFAPDEAAGRPFGVAMQAATPTGFSTSAPNTFTSRAGFVGLARELGLDAVPTGAYVVDFRCVDLEFTTVYQTYRATLTFTSPSTYSISGAAPAAGASTAAGPVVPLQPAGAAGQTGSTTVGLTAGSAQPSGPNTALVMTAAVAVAVLAAVAAVAHLARRRRSRRVPASSSRST